MKKSFLILLSAAMTTMALTFTSCASGTTDKANAETDSIARADSLAKAAEQARADSIAKANEELNAAIEAKRAELTEAESQVAAAKAKLNKAQKELDVYDNANEGMGMQRGMFCDKVDKARRALKAAQDKCSRIKSELEAQESQVQTR